MKLEFFLYLITYGLCVEGYKNNTNVHFEISCLENKDQRRLLSIKYNLILKLCIQNEETNVDDDFSCQIHSSSYELSDALGMCLRRKYDSRGKLKNGINFEMNWKRFYVYIIISVKTEKPAETKKTETHKKVVDPPFVKKVYQMEPFFSSSQQKIEIKFKLEVNCTKFFYGENCGKYCIDIPSHFECETNGSRRCLNDFQGEYCNKKTVSQCPDNIAGNCVEITNNTFQYEQLTVPCVSQDCDSAACVMSLIHLNESCFQLKANNTLPQVSYMAFTTPVTVLGAIIVLLLIIIFILLIYKRQRSLKPQRPPLHDHIHRMKIPLPTIQHHSIVDEYLPPESDYADMCSQCLSRDNNDSSTTYDDNLSLPMQLPNQRFLR